MSEFPQFSAQQPAPAPKKPRKWLPYVASVCAGLLGLAIGASGSSDSATEAATYASTHPTVTVTAPPVVKTVPTVPAACKEALDAADEALATAGQGFSIIADVMGAVSEFDVDAIEAGTQKLATLNKEKLTPQLEAYKTARDECQS